MNLKFFRKFMRPGDSSDDDVSSESDLGSDSREETYDDCLSDGSPDKSELSATQNSVSRPSGSIATELSDSNEQECCFVDLDSTDDFVQTSYALKCANFGKISTPSKGSTEDTKASVYPALGSMATETSVSSNGKEGCFGDVDSTDKGLQPATSLQFADSRKVSALSKGSTRFKNELQTLCQRNRINLPRYTHASEGPAHAPKFQAAVQIGVKSFRSEGNYNSKGEAEQAAAKEALEQLDVTSVLTVAGDSHVRLKKAEGQRTTCAGLTIETAIDLTEDQLSLGSSPPRSTLSSPAYNPRAHSAAISCQQLWGGTNDSTSFRGASVQKKSITSDTLAAPAGLDNTVHRNLAGQFSGLQLNGNDVAREAREFQAVKWPTQTERLQALGKLEFGTHAFPILARLNRLPLEEAFSVQEIEGLQNLPVEEVHQYLSDVDRAHRRLNESLPPPTASENKQGSTVLQRTLGFDRVLQVFLEDCSHSQHEIYKDILKNGIFAGPRVYHYFVHKDDHDDDKSADEEKRNSQGTVKCFFVCTDSKGEKDLNDERFQRFNTIAEARTLFMHVHTLPTISKYIARLQLCLSKSMTVSDISFSRLVIEEMEDLPSKDKANAKALFTDGTGFISADLARLIPASIFKGKLSEEGQKNELRKDYPSLLQVRFFHEGAAYKGTLLANKALPSNTIKFYKSMKKVQRDPLMRERSLSSFELVSTSRSPRRAKLYRDLIVLLSIGGVDESVFLEALIRAIDQVLMLLCDRKRAYQELDWEGTHEMAETTRHMLRAGIPMDEPGLKQNLIHLFKNKFKDFAIGKVPLDGTFYVMGTADPTGTLRPNEVVIFEGGRQVLGRVLACRAPTKHPGDLHGLDAVYSKALHDMVGGERNVIFFSTQGGRPVPHEIAKGDLDGDMYWVCENRKVVEQFKEWQPRWSPAPVNCRAGKGQASTQVSPAVLEDALIDQYLNERFDRSYVTGTASKRWLTHVDAYLHPQTSPGDREIHRTEFLKYPDYIYEAIDSSKTGKQVILFPEHDIGRRYQAPYLSGKSSIGEGPRSILGKIHEIGTQKARMMSTSFCREDFEVDPGFIVPGSENHIRTWEVNYLQYRRDMAQALANPQANPDGPNRVNKKWKMVLYEGPSFHERNQERQRVLEEASAIYQVVYRAAQKESDLGSPRFAFAWNVAGVALAAIYADNQSKETIFFSDGAYSEIHRRSKASVSAPRRT